MAGLDFESGTRVLVADDCIMTQAMLRGTLESWGVEVISANDGLEALAVLEGADPPRLALLDWMMPGLDGPDVCKKIRTLDDGNYLYIILLTSMDDREHLIYGLESGADDYMFKPFDPQELKVRLQAGARVVSLQEELKRKNALIREVFGRFVTDEVADTLLAAPEGLSLGGEKRIVTIMMSDLRGFTPLSEVLGPEEVVALLNRFLGTMVDIIFDYRGTIDEFVGDAILVIFGAPLSDSPREDACRAVACALAMQQAMEAFNRENKEMGLPEMGMGIGINTGEVVVGNIGSQKRMKYGVVGSPVNMTSRIESFTLGGQTLISQATLSYMKDIVRVDGRLRVKVKGVDGPVSIFDVGGIGGPYNLFLPEVDYRIDPVTADS